MKTINFILYVKTLLFGFVIWLFSFFYYFFQQTNTDSVDILGMISAKYVLFSNINKAFTFSGAVLILLSFALSGLSYFWGIGKGKLGYRKELGIVGFGFIVFHMLISDYLFTDGFTDFSYFISQPVKFIPSFIAVFIYILMIVVSNFGIPAKLGGVTWRRLLRVGYVAIFLSIIHFSLISYRQWVNWFSDFNPILPPLSLILCILSISTLLLRLALQISLSKKKLHNST